MAEETVSAEQQLQNFINKIAVEQNFKNFDIKISPVSTHGANYTSTLFKVKITGDGRELDVFAKVSALNEKIRVETKFNPFYIETEFYTNIIKKYRQLEEKHGVPDKGRLKYSAFYGVDMTYLREILVLEDLTSRGYGNPNRFESVDWSYASAAITELAKFHALSIALQHESSSDFDALITKLPGYIHEDNSGMDAIFQGGMASALAAVREENKEKLSSFFQSNSAEFFQQLYAPVNCKVIVHSDFRPNNMLHKVLDDGRTEVIPVDYQTLQPGSPVIDLLYFIFTATDGPFRAKYYQKLVDHYYSELGVSLGRLDLNIADKFPREKFDAELKEKLPFGLVMSIVLLPIIVVPEDSAPVIGDDFSSLAVNATSELYIQRLNDIVDDYVRWGVLGDSGNKTIAENTVSDEEHLLNFIKKIATEQNFKSFDIKITPMSTHGANYTSTLFKIKITGDGRELDLFAKVAALNEKVRAQTKFDPFEMENVFYTYLVKTYKQLEEKHGVPDKDRLKYPVYYGAESTHLREILVLEDLTSRGFGQANRFESVDWPYASAAITELAKFHALSFSFKHDSLNDFDKFITKIPGGLFEDNTDVDLLFKGGVASALAAVRKENEDKLNAFLKSQNLSESLNEMYKPVNSIVITHTDFRPNNMLHKVINNESTEVIPVDYQTLQPGSPVIDLINFIFTATDGPFRAKYYQKLVEHYYSELGLALGRLGLNVADKFPREDFEAELKEKLPYGLILTLGFLPILLVPEDNVPVIGDDFSDMVVNATSDLYSRRLNEVIDDYVRWGVLGNLENNLSSSVSKLAVTVSPEEHLLNFIKQIAVEQNFKNFDTKITPVSTHGANYSSTLFKIKITGEGRVLDAFAKVAAINEKVRAQTKFNLFEIEKVFYTYLVKTYRQLEKKHGVSDNDQLKVPVYYGAESTHMREILVLEDLTSRGFGQANRFESVDWPYASAAITELAKFHALSIAFQHENPSEFNNFILKIPGGLSEDNADVKLLFEGGKASALAAVREENKDKLSKCFNNTDIIGLFNKSYKPNNCKVIIHSDFRPNNMLHKVINNESTEVTPVDYQTLQPGSPVIDLLYFIFTATDGPFRAKYYQKLVEHYHTELGIALGKLNLTVADKFSKEKFNSELQEKLPFGLILTIGFLPIIVVPEDKAPTIGDDMSSMIVNATSDIYTRRLNEVVDDYVRWGVLGDLGNKSIAEKTVSAEEHLLNFIKKIAFEQNFKNFDTNITPVSTHGANYTSTLFKIKITGEGRELDVFAKVAALNEKVRAQTKFDPFDIEKVFYTYLVKTYRQLENKHRVADKDQLKVPVYYGAESTHLREILVLEDLTTRGFGQPNRFKSVDWPYASAAITELAKFHALSIAFQHENPCDFDKYIIKIPGGLFEDNPDMEPIFQGAVSSALAAVREENKDKLSKFLNSSDILDSFNKFYKPLNCKVIIHSDFRPNNMLHKVVNVDGTEVIPVDYQTLQPGSPVIDLLYFIFTATDGPFRTKYYQKLVDHYHSELGVALGRFGLNVADKFSRENFDSELQQKLPYGLILTVGFLPVLLVPEDKAPTIGDDFSNMVVSATSDVYTRRLNEVVDDYIKWGVLGDIKNNTIAEQTVSSDDLLRNFINKIAAEQNFKSFDINITPLSTHGANYTSTLFKIKIIGDEKELDVFAKVSALNEALRDETGFNPFDIEKEYYTNLNKIYRQLEGKHGIPDRYKLKVSTFYGVDMTFQREILVLEDLTSRGFGQANRFKSVDWSYAAAAITELAKFHALSIAFQHESPNDFDKFSQKIPGGIFENRTLKLKKKFEFVGLMFQGGVTAALAAVRKENKDKLNAFIDSRDILDFFNELFKPATCKVIIHSDFRPNNMLHKVVKDGKTEVIPVDYQTLQVGSPIVDLLYFIFAGTDGAFRAKFYQKLINHYYSELSVSLARLGLSIAHKYPRKAFESELREKLPFGLIVTIAFLPILMVPEDKAPELGGDASSMVVNATSDLYAQRLNEAVDDFVTYGVLGKKNSSWFGRCILGK